MSAPFPVLLLAAIRHPLDYPLLAEVAFAVTVLGAGALAVLWHHGRRAAHRFNTWWYCRRSTAVLLREIEHADKHRNARPQMPGHVPQPRRRIPLRRLPMRPERRTPTRTRKVR